MTSHKGDLKIAFSRLEPTVATDQAVWYRLGGSAKVAVEEMIRINKDEEATYNDLPRLQEELGLTLGVVRNDLYYGPSIHYPEVFADPLKSDEFYMLSPEGLNPKSALMDHFEPADSFRLSEKEVLELTRALFPAWGGHVSFIRRNPVLPRISSQKEPGL